MRVFSTVSAGITAGILVLSFFQAGCSSTKAPKTAREEAQRDTRIVHEDCDVNSGSAEKLDANGDGRPEVVIVKDGNREVCRAIDLNFDGVTDSYVYFEENGQVRRRENDYDRDGRIDEISAFRGGVILQKQRATMLTNKVDTWEFYDGGKLARSERDSNGDSVVDQWWEYTNPGCPLIYADVNSDGKPDPGAEVDYCKETGYVPPDRQDPKKADSPNFEQSGALPTEVDNKEAPPAPAPAATPAKSESTPAPAAPAPAKTDKGGTK